MRAEGWRGGADREAGGAIGGVVRGPKGGEGRLGEVLSREYAGKRREVEWGKRRKGRNGGGVVRLLGVQRISTGSSETNCGERTYRCFSFYLATPSLPIRRRKFPLARRVFLPFRHLPSRLQTPDHPLDSSDDARPAILVLELDAELNLLRSRRG